MDWTITSKVCCVGLAGGLVMLNVMAMDKPEINVPPNYYEPHEAPSNVGVPQWHENVVIAATATSGTAYSSGYSFI